MRILQQRTIAGMLNTRSHVDGMVLQSTAAGSHALGVQVP
jgi:hypothetical protein